MNKAKVAITKAKNKVGVPIVHKWIPKYSGVSGTIQAVATRSMAVDDKGVLQEVGGHVQPTLPRLLTWADALQIATNIDDYNVGADHLNVKLNTNWRRMYLCALRNVSYIKANGTPATKTENTIPCHNCGIVLPVEILQVDHHMPQADGDDLHILKTLRAMGMTVTVATGGKGTAIANGTFNTVTLNPAERDRTYNHLLVPYAAGKWTTSERGAAFLSLLAYVGGLNDVARMCKNSLLNLVPLSPECNRNKSDWVKPIV